MVWQIVVPIVSLLALLPLFTLSANPASVLGTSRLPASLVKPADAPRPLLSRMLAHQLLRYFTDRAEPLHNTESASSRHETSTLALLNRSASPLLTFCATPKCGPCDMLVLTLLHRRKPEGPAHDPHRGIIERWSRPAGHYLHASPTQSSAAAITTAALNGSAMALGVAIQQLRMALNPQLLSDPHDWQLVWRQALPGPAEHMASSADGRRLAVSFRKLTDESSRYYIR